MNPTKNNRVVGLVRTVPLWFRPLIKADTRPEDWKVVKLSGDRVGYTESKFL